MSTTPSILLMPHALFGSLVALATVWVFVDALNVNAATEGRVRKMSMLVAVLMWLTYLLGAYYYVGFYSADKAIIIKGPWSFAHNFFMETKEHVVIMLLLLATYLPVAASGNLVANKAARSLVLWVAGLIVLIAVAMDGTGAIISMGVRVALLPK